MHFEIEVTAINRIFDVQTKPKVEKFPHFKHPLNILRTSHPLRLALTERLEGDRERRKLLKKYRSTLPKARMCGRL